MTLRFSDVDRDVAKEALAQWDQAFKKKINKKSEKKSIFEKADSIALQMLSLLEKERFSRLCAAYNDDNEPMAFIIICDSGHKKMTIRFLLSNIANTQAKGAGLFLIEQITAWAKSRSVHISATSENADKFWKKVPGFIENPHNPGEFVYQPHPVTATLSTVGSFRADASEKKTEKPGHRFKKTP